MIPYPVLLCDVGSSFSRFGTVRAPGEPVEILRRLRTTDFGDLASAARRAISDSCFDDGELQPASLLASIAGPVHGCMSRLAKGNWRVDGKTIASKLGLERGLLLNDFETLALSLSVREPGWVKPIGYQTGQRQAEFGMTKLSMETETTRDKVQIIIGLGETLGCAALVPTGRRFVALPSDAANNFFGPESAEEEQIWRHMDDSKTSGKHRQIRANDILSSPGIRRLHRARLFTQGSAPALTSASEIIECALAEPASEAAKTVKMYWRLIARFAGDLALTFSAAGGVTLTGNLPKRLSPLLDHGEFRRHFENARPAHAQMPTIATQLLVRDDALMHGLAAIAADPSRYAIDYANRDWV